MSKQHPWHSYCRVCDPERVKAISRGHIGILHSAKTKKKISQKLKGRKGPRLGHHASEETKLKMSKSLKGKTKGRRRSAEFRKKVSTGMLNHMKICDGSCGGFGCKPVYTLTSIHRALIHFLKYSGFCVINEKKFGRYYVDCYVPELNIAFEADGERWHNAKLDKIRDKYIFDNFQVPVVRFTGSEIWANWRQFYVD